jgi:hypothetical protein
MWIICFSPPFSVVDGHIVHYNGPTLWHILALIFWSTLLAITWYFYHLIHDMAGEYLCTPSICLFWCGAWSLHVAIVIVPLAIISAIKLSWLSSVWNKQEFSMNFYNKQEFSMNLCNFQQFLKLSKINKYFLRTSSLNKNFLCISRIE